MTIGEVWETPAFPWTMRIQNTSAREVEITQFATSCDCISITPSSKIIPAHGEAELRLSLNLVGKLTSDDQPIREFSAEVRPVIAGSNWSPAWLVTGRVRRAFNCAPRELNYGESLIKNRQFQARTIQVRALAPLSNITAESTIGEAHVKRLPGPQSAFEITFLPHESLNVGSLTGVLKIQAFTKVSDRLIETLVPIRGQIVTSVELLPRELIFGRTPVDRYVSQTVVIQSRLGNAISVDSIESDLLGFEASAKRTIDRGKSAFDVRFLVSNRGLGNGVVTLRVRPEGEDQILLKLPVSYYGVP